MANQLILHPQKFNFEEINCQFPSGKIRKTIFFQSELRSLGNGDASFGVIAYPGWEEDGKWTVGTKVEGKDTGKPVMLPFTPPLAFANNELLLSVPSVRDKKGKKKINKNCSSDFHEAIRKLMKKKELVAKSSFMFEAKISENPHLEYDVTLDTGDGTYRANTNPSPPAKPME